MHTSAWRWFTGNSDVDVREKTRSYDSKVRCTVVKFGVFFSGCHQVTWRTRKGLIESVS